MRKNHRKIIIKNSDFAKLQNLIEKSDSEAAEVLEAEILSAKLVEDSKLPIDVVAMGSTVTFKRKEGGEITVVTLVYPQQADMEKKQISILTPVGSALIGLQTGGEIDWPMPNGKLSHFEVVAVQQT